MKFSIPPNYVVDHIDPSIGDFTKLKSGLLDAF